MENMNKDLKRRIFDFLSSNKVAVIATIDTDKNSPESAVVGFAQTEDLEIIFGTANTTRKYKNLLNNQKVSFVVGFTSEGGTLQYEGIAAEIGPDELEKYTALLIEKNPYHKNFVKDSNQKYFLVKPTWIRFLDMSANPPQTQEITL